MTLLERIKNVFREPDCESPDGHKFGEQDPDGGWWCNQCDTLFVRTPRPSEM